MITTRTASLHRLLLASATAGLLVARASAQEAPRRPAAAPVAADVPAPTAEVATKAPAAKAPTVWGFVNLQYTRTDAPSPARPTSSSEIRRARIGVKGDVTPHVGYSFLFDGADASLKDAYAAVKGVVPGLELRAGQLKTPFGYEQPESDTKLLWVSASYVVQALARATTTASLTAAGDSRDIGLALLGRWALGGGAGAEVALAGVNGAGPNRRDDLAEKNVWGRAGVSARSSLATLRAGGSYGAGRQLAGVGANGRFDGVGTPVDDVTFHFQTYGGDVTLDARFLFAAVEVIQSERDVWDRGTGVRRDVLARGWYAGLYGKTPWNAGPVLRVERFDRDRAAAGDRNVRYTAGAYVDLLPVNARLVLNYEVDRSQRAVRAGDRAILLGQVIF